MTKPEPSRDLDDDRNLFSFTSLFFWNVAFAISQLVSNDYLQLEIRVTPINDLARSIRDEAESCIVTEGKGMAGKVSSNPHQQHSRLHRNVVHLY
jgi:hypothetical protein